MLCGYPMGAKICADLVSNNKISQKEGQYLLLFTNNVSPMFVISYINSSALKNKTMDLSILAAIYLAPIILSLVFNKRFRDTSKTIHDLSLKTSSVSKTFDFKMLDQGIMDGFETVTKLGGYIILFSIISSFIQEKTEINLLVKSVLLGLVEITTGIDYIGSSTLPYYLKAFIICMITSFGGLSSLAQTNSMIKEAGLSIKPYFFSKILTGILSAFIYLLKYLH